MNETKVIGIVLRYADSHFGDDVDTIEAHNRVVKHRGKVYVGKVGKPLADKYLRLAEDKKADTRLLLVTKKERTYEIYSARTIGGTRGPVKEELVPSYYRDSKLVSCWFLLNEPLRKMPRDEMRRWVVASSGNSLLESLCLSMSGFFIAKLGKRLITEAELNAVAIRKRTQKGKRLAPRRIELMDEWDDDRW